MRRLAFVAATLAMLSSPSFAQEVTLQPAAPEAVAQPVLILGNLNAQPSTLRMTEGRLARTEALIEIEVTHARTGVLAEELDIRRLTGSYSLPAGSPVYLQFFGNSDSAWCGVTPMRGLSGPYDVGLCMFPGARAGAVQVLPTEAGLTSPYYANAMQPSPGYGRMPVITEGPAGFGRTFKLSLNFGGTDRRDFDFSLYFIVPDHSVSRIQQIDVPRQSDGTAILEMFGGRFRIQPTDDRTVVTVEVLEPPFALQR